jgi:hypothetical protein
MKNLILLSLFVLVSNAQANQVCRGYLSLPLHPEWSGQYLVESYARFGRVTLSNGFGTQSFLLTRCKHFSYGFSCEETTQPAYTISGGDTPGITVGVQEGDQWTEIGQLTNCR